MVKNDLIGLAPKSEAASNRRPSNFTSWVYSGRIMNGK